MDGAWRRRPWSQRPARKARPAGVRHQGSAPTCTALRLLMCLGVRRLAKPALTLLTAARRSDTGVVALCGRVTIIRKGHTVENGALADPPHFTC
ncbi:MAG: hypothetical protein IRY90_16845 [Actinomadura rubrobrunea]|nr:hypothetical protein [Actinomadura rubrobrunea]